MKNKIYKYLFLAWFYGATYTTIEVLYRGRSHWSMLILSAMCCIIIGILNERLPWNISFILQMFIGGAILTLGEICVGYFVNTLWNWNIWNYSALPFTYCNGNINLFFSMIWCALSGVVIVVDDYLKYWLFNEEKPHYRR